MQEITGNIWDYHRKGHWIVIPTNSTVKSNGECVMGRGLALQVKQKYPRVPKLLGKAILDNGNIVHDDGDNGLIFFPVKHNWYEKANLELIEQSIQELVELFDTAIVDYPIPIYLPRVGCGNGKLDWKDVKLILEKYLDDRFVIVDWLEKDN